MDLKFKLVQLYFAKQKKSFTKSVLQSKSFIKEKNVSQEKKTIFTIAYMCLQTKKKKKKRNNGVIVHDLLFVI